MSATATAPTPPSALPTGTVTFLFTDVEGSTRLWERFPDEMRGALARHDALIEQLTERHAGCVVRPRGEGDSRFCVFARATDAVAAAAAIQRALAAEPWPKEVPLRVRAALHTGEADLRDGDYYGSAVNRAARIRAVAHGGQTLLSMATEELVRDALPRGVALRDLGEHRLKDLHRPERIFEVLGEGLPEEFPALRSLDALPNNLPLQLTTFIGREDELAEARALLRANRLLSLIGTGGCGKTRLSLQVAADELERFPDGVWFVELAPVADEAHVPAAVAGAMGVTLDTTQPPLPQLVNALRTKHALLVLDNCEHVIEACAKLADALLRGCPQLQILATSREALGIAGERAWRIPSLGVPGAEMAAALTHGTSGVAALTQYEAVRLFVDRACAVQPSFQVTNQNAPAVAQVCHRLDGIPLAIELAAARVKVLSVEQIAQRLDDSFRLLTGGSRTALPRQQTLRALVDWSYALLSPKDRAVLRRASVFMGGFTLEAAEYVCAGGDASAGGGVEVEEWEVLDLLSELVDKSLVQSETRDGAARYRLLETIRLYGRQRLIDAGEAEATRDRHLAWCLRLVLGPDPSDAEAVKSRSGSGGRDLTPFRAEHENLRSALEWSLERDPRAGMRLALGLGFSWSLSRLGVDPGAWLDGLLARLPERDDLRAFGLVLSAIVHRMCGQLEIAKAHLAECGAYFDRTGNRLGQARAMDQLGLIAAAEGDHAGARGLYERSLAIMRELDDPWTSTVLRNVALAAIAQRDYARAKAALADSLALARRRDDASSTTRALVILAAAHRLEGDREQARALLGEASAIWQRSAARGQSAAGPLRYLGDVVRDEGDLAGARALYDEFLGRDNVTGLAVVSRGMYVVQIGVLAGREGDHARCARLLAAVPDGTISLMRMHFPDVEIDYLAARDAARDALGEEAFAAAWAQGSGLSLEQAIQQARGLE